MNAPTMQVYALRQQSQDAERTYKAFALAQHQRYNQLYKRLEQLCRDIEAQRKALCQLEYGRTGTYGIYIMADPFALRYQKVRRTQAHVGIHSCVWWDRQYKSMRAGRYCPTCRQG